MAKYSAMSKSRLICFKINHVLNYVNTIAEYFLFKTVVNQRQS